MLSQTLSCASDIRTISVYNPEEITRKTRKFALLSDNKYCPAFALDLTIAY